MVKEKTLHILPLQYPVILLPTSRITIPITQSLAESLVKLAQGLDVPIVGAVPRQPPVANDESEVVQLLEGPLQNWGCLARVVSISRDGSAPPPPPSQASSGALSEEQDHVLTLQGITRIQLAHPLPPRDIQPLTKHAVSYTDNHAVSPSEPTFVAFRVAALRMLDALSAEGKSAFGLGPARVVGVAGAGDTKDRWRKLRKMVEDMSWPRAIMVAEGLVAAIGASYEDTMEFLSALETDSRLVKATEIFTKRTSIAEVSSKISQDVDESLSKHQKEFYLRQQMEAIQRELGRLQHPTRNSNSRSHSDPNGAEGDVSRPGPVSELDDDGPEAEMDDLAELKARIESMVEGSEERKMGVREWKRLKRTPQGSVENGVIRNYLEWLTTLPWPSNSGDALSHDSPLLSQKFLKVARAQLDKDHFGLDKIKRRLIEYLAVLRLKEVQARREEERDRELERERERERLSATGVSADTSISSVLPTPPTSPQLTPPSQSKLPQQKSQPSTSIKSPKLKTKSPILLLTGPPGTGKTSIAQSIATALHRPFQRISLGGVRDEAEIRGHRRTYVASGPGAIVQALRKAGRLDPVILLDEIDKVGSSNFHGDPSAALLEVLDPEQNHSFVDHYLNVPIDLSQVLFIATANSLEYISMPLYDRCEAIFLSGYTYNEKQHIARRFLIPKQLIANGFSEDRLTITDDALLYITTRYTREAGVRSLEREIAAVVRYKAVEWAEWSDVGEEADAKESIEPSSNAVSLHPRSKDKAEYTPIVDTADLQRILGLEGWDGEERPRDEPPRKGHVYGLVVFGMGEGGLLSVETMVVPGGSGWLKLTGRLGEVIRESGELALTWVKAHSYALGITSSPSEDPLKHPEPFDIHLHLPSGAQRKDGPSAGIALVCAFVSLLTGHMVPTNVAMTGEVTLRGLVAPVGGIKEKILGAHRDGITKVILPRRNKKDAEHDLEGADEIRQAMELVFVGTVREALEAAFGSGVLQWRNENGTATGTGSGSGTTNASKLGIENRL